jgi:PPOX class probable F420-dependent enzyme
VDRVEPDEALARLRAARVGRLATVTPGGRPHVVPFVFALIEDGAGVHVVWAVDRKPKRTDRIRRLENLEANPFAEVVVDGYDEEWSRLWWVRASGRARIVTEGDERERALVALAEKYDRYRAEPPDGPVVVIDVDRISSWSGSDG